MDSYVTYRLFPGTIGVEILHYHLSVRGGEQQWCTLSVICVKRFVVVQDVLADNV